MPIMPRFTLRVMRLLTGAMLYLIRRWEDQNGDVQDYRMNHMTAGLWQAAQSMRELMAGEFNPVYKNSLLADPDTWSPKSVLGQEYLDELIGEARIPLRPAD